MDDPVRTNKTPWALIGLLGLVVLGAVLRWWNIGRESLWVDEALTFIVARHEVSRLFLEPIDPSGPIYYLAHKWFVGGVAGTVETRMVSWVAGVVLIPVVYAIARQACDRVGALTAAALVALAPVLVDYSQEARAYSLLTLFFALVALCLLKADGSADAKTRRWWLAGFTVASLLALFTHLIAFPFVGLAMLWLRLAADRKGASLKPWEAWTVWGVAGGIGLLEFRRLFLYASDANRFGWLREPTVAESLELLGGQWVPVLRDSLLAIAVPILVAGLFVLCWRRRRPSDGLSLLLVGGWLAQPLILLVISLTLQPVLMTRTMLPSWPAFALLIVYASTIFTGNARHGVRLAAVLVTAAGLALVGTTREKTDWNGAVEALRDFDGEVLVCPYWRAPALLQALEQEWRVAWVLYSTGKPVMLDARADGDWVTEFLFKENGRRDPNARDRLDHLILVSAECPSEEQAQVDQLIGERSPHRTIRIVAPSGTGDALSGQAIDIVIDEYLPDAD